MLCNFFFFFFLKRGEVLSPDDENSQSYKSPPFTKTKSTSTESFKDFQPEDEITSSENNDIEEKLTIVFETTKCIEVLLTPIFLKIVEEFLEQINDKVCKDSFYITL